MRKVIRAKLHDLQIVLPGVGTLGNDLPLKNKTLDLTMVEGPNGIEIAIKGTPGVAIIPYANIQMYVTAVEEAVVAKKSAKDNG